MDNQNLSQKSISKFSELVLVAPRTVSLEFAQTLAENAVKLLQKDANPSILNALALTKNSTRLKEILTSPWMLNAIKILEPLSHDNWKVEQALKLINRALREHVKDAALKEAALMAWWFDPNGKEYKSEGPHWQWVQLNSKLLKEQYEIDTTTFPQGIKQMQWETVLVERHGWIRFAYETAGGRIGIQVKDISAKLPDAVVKKVVALDPEAIAIEQVNMEGGIPAFTEYHKTPEGDEYRDFLEKYGAIMQKKIVENEVLRMLRGEDSLTEHDLVTLSKLYAQYAKGMENVELAKDASIVISAVIQDHLNCYGEFVIHESKDSEELDVVNTLMRIKAGLRGSKTFDERMHWINSFMTLANDAPKWTQLFGTCIGKIAHEGDASILSIDRVDVIVNQWEKLQSFIEDLTAMADFRSRIFDKHGEFCTCTMHRKASLHKMAIAPYDHSGAALAQLKDQGYDKVVFIANPWCCALCGTLNRQEEDLEGLLARTVRAASLYTFAHLGCKCGFDVLGEGVTPVHVNISGIFGTAEPTAPQRNIPPMPEPKPTAPAAIEPEPQAENPLEERKDENSNPSSDSII